LSAEYDSVYQIAVSRQNFEKFAVKFAKKDSILMYYYIIIV